MSIWTTLFLEGWKRYHAKLAYKWNTLTVFQATEQVGSILFFTKYLFTNDMILFRIQIHINFCLIKHKKYEEDKKKSNPQGVFRFHKKEKVQSNYSNSLLLEKQ